LKCSLPQPNCATSKICNRAAAFFIMFIVSALIWNRYKAILIYFQAIYVIFNCAEFIITGKCKYSETLILQ
jgi:hypothetical protein